ncbi:cupin domain-containing protein [Gordonia sp. ABSL1-1]|uniref:cupin domain-containing protein n=1 Tax=Gordonia sp. ABSL1-1 TaxID=3053923 RepID=UPI0025722668|nr:cupin domain-containing protein [Gordonia sp. ABSL1-1]MDL9938619.1 cupin domain-containing protein [Gordonia sp. ABSL1-1]
MARRLRHAVAAFAATALVIPALLSSTVADATPSSGVSAVTLAKADIPAALLPFLPDGMHVEVREITIVPGGTTGWHYHDGNLIGLIRQGTLTHPGSDCTPVIYRTGDIIREPAGKANTHQGTNLGSVPVVLDVLYLIPLGAPLSEDAPAPGCA